MPRSLQPDRKLFGVTLALCLIGAVMVFSASAMTARESGGNGYTFLLQQLVWIAMGLAGMFWLMNTDYRKFRQPRVIFTAVSLTLVMLIAVFFLDRSHATHRWVRLRPSEFAAVGNCEAGFDFLPRMVPRNSASAARCWSERSSTHASPRARNGIAHCCLILAEPDMGTACMIFLIAVAMLFVVRASISLHLRRRTAAIPPSIY